MDVEEYVRMHLVAGEDEDTLVKNLIGRITEIKNTSLAYTEAFARAVVEEVKNTKGPAGYFFEFEPARVKMGEFGVGSRGKGDFFAHRGKLPGLSVRPQHLSVWTRWTMPGRSAPRGIYRLHR